jgi:hypothetical protein
VHEAVRAPHPRRHTKPRGQAVARPAPRGGGRFLGSALKWHDGVDTRSGRWLHQTGRGPLCNRDCGTFPLPAGVETST